MKRDARDILKEVGLKKTNGRILVLETLLNSDRPLVHEDILNKIGNENINRVTIYRILNQLLEKGVVHKIVVGDRKARFAVCDHIHFGHCHPHFSCKICGKVECLRDVTILPSHELKTGYIIEEQEVYMRGICANCAKKIFNKNNKVKEGLYK